MVFILTLVCALIARWPMLAAPSVTADSARSVKMATIFMAVSADSVQRTSAAQMVNALRTDVSSVSLVTS